MKENKDKFLFTPNLFYKLTCIEYFKNFKENSNIFIDYNLLIITNGTGNLVIDNIEYTLDKGKCFIVTPNMSKIILNNTNELCFYLLKFDVTLSQESSDTSSRDRISTLLICKGEVLCTPFSQCIDLVDNIYKNFYCDDEITAFNNHILFQQLLLFIFKQNVTSKNKKDIGFRIKKSIEYIDINFRRSLTVEDLSTLSDISRNKYTSLFKNITGQVPLEYINNIRINRAKQLLLTTDDKLFDIAQSVGFNDEYYFSRRFKQTLGISPGQYRRNNIHHPKIFAPYLEDFILSLGVKPMLQCFHSNCGKQDYLGLNDVPIFNILNEDINTLSYNKPDFIIIDEEIEFLEKDCLNKIAPTYVFAQPGEDWRSILVAMGELIGRSDKVYEVIMQYEEKARLARKTLEKSIRKQSVVCLRSSADGVYLYSGENKGYTGPVLYKDLNLTPHPLVDKLAGSERVVRLTLDELSALKADHIFITFDKHYNQIEGDERKILDSSIWKSLPAVRRNNVYEVDFMSWMNYGVLSHNKKIDDVLKALG